ncbi:UBP-type zinc finger domain-containing protein [Actinoallomurus acanthiterrae]
MTTITCEHVSTLPAPTPEARTPEGCEDCLRMGGRWVHLRLCLTCGHIGCCDSSPNKHATAHHHETSHPIVRSFEPGEDWRWCYADEVIV